MAGKSNIEWTEHTWNPIVGCSVLSPGCTNCYAMKMAARIEAMKQSHYDGTTKKVNGNAVWTGRIQLAPGHILNEPLHRKKPTTYFVNSMGDLFHEDAPDEWILRVLDVIRRTSFDGGSNCGTIKGEHTYQLLTKRAARMASFMPRLRFNPSDERGLYLSDDGGPSIVMKNLWLGVSAERQKEADERIPLLLQTPAAVRFVSCEPLLGPINLQSLALPKDWERCTCTEHIPGLNALSASIYCEGCCEGPEALDLGRLDWVIVGGESGPGARPMHPDWARSIRDACGDQEVPFFFKQWGEWGPHKVEAGGDLGGDVRDGRVMIVHPSGCSSVEVSVATGGHSTEKGSRYMARVGKKSAGRTLDSSLHSDMPRGRG